MSGEITPGELDLIKQYRAPLLDIPEPSRDVLRRYHMEPRFHARVHLAVQRLNAAFRPLTRDLDIGEAEQLEDLFFKLAVQLVLDQENDLSRGVR